MKFGTNAKAKELKNIGSFYANSIQTDEYFLPFHLINKRDLAEPAFIADSLVMDESYSDYKNLATLFVGKSTLPLGVYNLFNYPQSSSSVLNNFRSDFTDFSHFNDTSLDLGDVKSLVTNNQTDTLFSTTQLVTEFNQSTAATNDNTLVNVGISNQEVNPTQLN